MVYLVTTKTGNHGELGVNVWAVCAEWEDAENEVNRLAPTYGNIFRIEAWEVKG